MTQIVVMPGGFHPFHAGHYALYQSARRAFPRAQVFVAATNDTSTRPFPFPVKEKLAKLAGVEPGHFVQVKSPFRAEEITSKFNPEKDVLIFVRSEKDADKPPQAGGVKRDGSPSYLQPLQGQTRYEPFAKHAYMAYLPTVEFGPGMTSATEIRSAWPQLDERRKTALVMSLYPKTQGNAKLAATVVNLLDAAISGSQDVAESSTGVSVRKWANQVRKDHSADVKFFNRKEGGGAVDSVIARNSQGETVGVYNRKTGYPTVFEPKQGVDENQGWAATLEEKHQGNLDAEPELKQTRQYAVQHYPELASDPDLAFDKWVQRSLQHGPEDDQKQFKMLQGVAEKVKRLEQAVAQARAQQSTVEESDYIEEKWSQKYKSSINCANPKGFSQKAHCAGRKK